MVGDPDDDPDVEAAEELSSWIVMLDTVGSLPRDSMLSDFGIWSDRGGVMMRGRELDRMTVCLFDLDFFFACLTNSPPCSLDALSEASLCVGGPLLS